MRRLRLDQFDPVAINLRTITVVFLVKPPDLKRLLTKRLFPSRQFRPLDIQPLACRSKFPRRMFRLGNLTRQLHFALLKG